MTEVTEVKRGTFTATAGPIQVKRVNKAINKLEDAYWSFTSNHDKNVVMRVYDLRGTKKPEYIAAFNAIGEKFAWTLTRENAKVVEAAFLDAAKAKMETIPTEDAYYGR